MDLVKSVLDRIAYIGGLLFFLRTTILFLKGLRKGETPE